MSYIKLDWVILYNSYGGVYLKNFIKFFYIDFKSFNLKVLEVLGLCVTTKSYLLFLHKFNVKIACVGCGFILLSNIAFGFDARTEFLLWRSSSIF